MTTVRTNLGTNPAPGSITGWGTSSQYVRTFETVLSRPAMVCTRAAASASVNLWYGRHTGLLTSSTGTPTVMTGLPAVTPGQTVYASADMGTDRADTRGSLNIRWFTAAGAANGMVTGTPTAMAVNTWETFTLSGVAPAGSAFFYVENVVQTATGNTVGGERSWAGRAYLSTSPGSYFDGGTAAHDNVAYRWLGTANASASEEYYAKPTVLVEELAPAPGPAVGITVVALGAGETVYNLWRVAGGKRAKVREGGDREAVEADYVEDYEIPPNIPVTYEIEILSGPGVSLQTYSATIQVYSATGWLQDPLVPGSAVPIDGYSREDGRPVLLSPSLSELLYEADVSYITVMGTDEPVALIGQRAQANGVSLNLVTKAAEHSNDLRVLALSSGPLLLRPVAPWGDTLPPLCYLAPGTVREMPRQSRTGVPGVSDWDAVSPLIKAPSMDVLVPRWTWGDWEGLYATWSQAESVLSGLTWLDVTKNPTGV